MLRDKIKQLLARLLCTTEWAGEANRANRWLALDMAFEFIACVPSSSSTGVHPCWLRENFPYKSKPKAVDLPSIRWAPNWIVPMHSGYPGTLDDWRGRYICLSSYTALGKGVNSCNVHSWQQHRACRSVACPWSVSVHSRRVLIEET